MKKINLAIILLTVMSLSLIACSGKEVETSADVSKKTEVEKEVEITLDNVYDYIDFVQVDEHDKSGNLTGYKTWLCVSKIYDEGWVFKESSDVTFRMISGNEIREGSCMMYNDTMGRWKENEAPSDKPVIEKISGSLTFAKYESLQEYSFTLESKDIVFADGHSQTVTTYNGFYVDYPY